MSQVFEVLIGILDEHSDWSFWLMVELIQWGLPWEKIDYSSYAFDLWDRWPVYSVIVNRISPSSYICGY